MPKAGHWIKLRNGKEVEILALPQIADVEKPISLTIESNQNELAKLTKQIEEEKDGIYKTPDKLTNPHELIQKAIESLKGKEPDRWAKYPNGISTPSGVININVTRDLQGKALLFMDSLLKISLKQGYIIKITGEETQIVKDDISFNIRCRERYKSEMVKEGNWDRRIQKPTGIMVFRAEYRYSHTKEWTDAKTLLKDQFANIFAWLEIHLQKIQEEKKTLQEYREEMRLQEQERLRLKAIQEWEIQKRKLLHEHFNRWQKANEFRAFIVEVENLSASEGIREENISEWIMWAKDEAAIIDPFAGGVLAFIDSYFQK